jgi:hypothetical protein
MDGRTPSRWGRRGDADDKVNRSDGGGAKLRQERTNMVEPTADFERTLRELQHLQDLLAQHQRPAEMRDVLVCISCGALVFALGIGIGVLLCP